MRRWLIIILPVLAAAPAWAQTTWNSADKNAGITLSNGNLTAASSATNVLKAVRATTAKFSGKWCYQFTVNNAPSNINIGLANAEWPLAPGVIMGNVDNESAGLVSSTGKVMYRNTGTVTADAPVNGKTGEVCADLSNQPPLLWVTPDVSGTSGAGGGPKWNGSATATPVGDVGGVLIYFPAGGFLGRSTCCFFPAFMGFNNDSVTAAFTGFTPPTGYNTWDTAGGDSPTPGPLSPMSINVSNAPAWQATHSYALKDRVVGGSAWNGSTYTSAQPLCLFAVKVAGTSGSSASVFNTACLTGIPANVGGGLDGTVPSTWNAATTVIDGGVTWVLLSKIDYTTLTGAFVDDPLSWSGTTAYQFNTWLYNGANAYLQNTQVSFVGQACTSGSSGGPTGTGLQIVDGTCKWDFKGAIPYSSRANQWPHLIQPLGQPLIDLNEQQVFDVTIRAWYGGAQQQTYHSGVNSEYDPIPVLNHNGNGNDQLYMCYHYGAFGYDGSHTFDNNPYARNQSSCNGLGRPFIWTLTVPSGDSFVDNVSPTIGPLRIDSTKGVTLLSTSTPHFSDDRNSGQPLWTIDQNLIIERLQVQATLGMAMYAQTSNFIVRDDIFDGGPSAPGTIYIDAQGDIHDIVVITRSTEPGCFGILTKYRGPIYNVTAIGSSTTNCTFYQVDYGIGIAAYSTSYAPPPLKNLTFFGYPNHYAYWNSTWPVFDTAGNATDASATPSTTPFTTPSNHPFGTQTFTPAALPGINSTCGASNSSPCTGLSASNNLVNPTIGASLDARLKTTADVRGAGATFSYDTSPFWQGLVTPGRDILGTARPQP